MGKEKGDNPLPGNKSVVTDKATDLRKNLAKDEVREGIFKFTLFSGMIVSWSQEVTDSAANSKIPGQPDFKHTHP